MNEVKGLADGTSLESKLSQINKLVEIRKTQICTIMVGARKIVEAVGPTYGEYTVCGDDSYGGRVKDFFGFDISSSGVNTPHLHKGNAVIYGITDRGLVSVFKGGFEGAEVNLKIEYFTEDIGHLTELLEIARNTEKFIPRYFAKKKEADAGKPSVEEKRVKALSEQIAAAEAIAKRLGIKL